MSDDITKEQFLELVARYQQRIFGYIYALVHNVEDAQDVHQQTLMVLWSKFGQYKPGTNFLAWATKIAQLETFSFRRSNPSRQVLLSTEAITQVAECQVREALCAEADAYRLETLLETCIEKLPEADRELLDKCYWMRCRIRDIATELGRTSQSICNTLRRIRSKLFQCIDRASLEYRDS